jgi:hypothetical protein
MANGVDVVRLKNEFIMEFALWIAPVEEIARQPDEPTLDAFRLAIVRFDQGTHSWNQSVQRFRQQVQYPLIPPGLGSVYSYAHDQIGSIYSGLYSKGVANGLTERKEYLRQLLDQIKNEFLGHMDMIPVTWDAEMFSGESPLTAHLRIKDVIKTAKNRVHYSDRYMRDDVFPLYLRDLDRNLEITLVTTRGNAGYGVIHLLPVATLAKAEFPNFHLIQVDQKDMHGRKLRIDDQVFLIDSGITPGGKPQPYPNEFAPADSTQAGHDALDDLIRNGTVVV